MKCIIITAIAFLLAGLNTLFAQSSAGVAYQAVARDSFGTPLPNKTIRLRFTIHTGTGGGTSVYQEVDSTTTDKLGGFVIEIGSGTVTSGTFSAIDWNSGAKYLQVEVDPAGGTSYTDMGTERLMSVPYALSALTTKGVDGIAPRGIPYRGSTSALTSDDGFTRDTGYGNTQIIVQKGDKNYGLLLGDQFSPLGAAQLIYGDTLGTFSAMVGVGKYPPIDQYEIGFFDISDTLGNNASIDLMESPFDGAPMVVGSAVMMGAPYGAGGNLYLHPALTGLFWGAPDPGYKMHGFAADSANVKIYNSDTNYFWRWPNAEGLAGQAMVTDGSGNLSFTSITGKGSALGAHAVYQGNNTTTDTLVIAVNQNNIFDPTASSVNTLRVQLPNSPGDGDVFILTFEKAVTTVTYLNGTVAGGAPATANASTQRIFTYHSANSKWY